MSTNDIRWSQSEYLTIARAGIRNKHQGTLAVFKLGQTSLPKDRRRSLEHLEQTLRSKSQRWLDELYERAAQLPESFITAPMDDPKPPQKPEDGKAKTKAYWTKLEWARCARQVEELRKGDPTTSLARLYKRAQQMVIAADRRKTPLAFTQSAGKGKLEEYHKQGLADVWLLPKDAPPTKTATEAANVDAMVRRLEEAVSGPSAPVAAVVAPVPAALPPTLTALTIETPGLEAALATFGSTLAGAVGLLVQASQRETRSLIDSKLAAASARIGEQVAAVVRESVGGMVVAALTDALNAPVAAQPPVAAPAAPAAPKPAPMAAPAASPAALASAPAHEPQRFSVAAADPVSEAGDDAQMKKLRVDVVGFERGDHCSLVVKAVQHFAEVRFVHPDERAGYTPHRGRSVLLMIGRNPHVMSNKLKAAKIKPISIGRSPHHAIHAIEELGRSKGMSV